MRHDSVAHRERRPSRVDRLELWLSTAKLVDGLWIGASFGCEPDTALPRVEAALDLIKVHDRLRYHRLTRDLERIWVRPIPSYLGVFNAALRACELDSRFVLAEGTTPELIAATIVHEATHARIESRRVAYREDLRTRVERACLRRELAFATKLSNGAAVRDRAERTLTLCDSETYWTNAAFAERFDQGHIAALRDLGAPEWVIRATLALRTVRLRMVRLTRRLTSS